MKQGSSLQLVNDHTNFTEYIGFSSSLNRVYERMHPFFGIKRWLVDGVVYYVTPFTAVMDEILAAPGYDGHDHTDHEMVNNALNFAEEIRELTWVATVGMVPRGRWSWRPLGGADVEKLCPMVQWFMDCS